MVVSENINYRYFYDYTIFHNLSAILASYMLVKTF